MLKTENHLNKCINYIENLGYELHTTFMPTQLQFYITLNNNFNHNKSVILCVDTQELLTFENHNTHHRNIEVKHHPLDIYTINSIIAQKQKQLLNKDA